MKRLQSISSPRAGATCVLTCPPRQSMRAVQCRSTGRATTVRAILAAVVCWWIVGASHRDAVQADELPEPVEQQAYAHDSTHGLLAARTTSKFLGARSCAATACHGGIEPDGRFALSRRHEYTQWLDRDPHARGQFTLAQETSQAILRRLARRGEPPEDQAARLANCLACHNPQPSSTVQANSFYSRDGVSCEICHGAAEKWIGAHVEAHWAVRKREDRAAWKSFAGERGFVDTEDLTVRGETCAQCHVGSPGREVNHDLIAAGHPVLKFELAAYHDLLPKHWRAAEARQADPNFEVQLWSAGQTTTIAAALALLDWRASDVPDKHPDAAWPELAEYDCFACHHDLEDPSWRRQRTVAGLPLGMPAWSTWNMGPLRQMGSRNDPLRQRVAVVAEQMQAGFGQDRDAVRAAAAEAAREVATWGRPDDLESIGRQMRHGFQALLDHQRLNDAGQSGQPANWDEAVQLYLAIVAFDHQRSTIDPADINLARSLFRFPKSYDSPRGFLGQRPLRTPSDDPRSPPGSRSRQRVIAALVTLIEQLKTNED